MHLVFANENDVRVYLHVEQGSEIRSPSPSFCTNITHLAHFSCLVYFEETAGIYSMLLFFYVSFGGGGTSVLVTLAAG